MKITCEIIRDLLPLYAEELASPDSRVLVEEHTAQCPACKRQLDELRTPTPAAPAAPMTTVNRLLRRRTLLWCVLVGCLVAALALGVLGRMTSGQLIYDIDTELLCARDLESGIPYVRVGKTAPLGIDYRTYTVTGQDGAPSVMVIDAYTSPWLQAVARDRRGQAYYAESAEIEIICFRLPSGDLQQLYGPEVTFGMQLLRKLTLNYYFLGALVLSVIFAALWLWLRRLGHGKPVLLCLLACLSYLLAQLLVKGIGGASDFLLQDLTFILLSAASLWCAGYAALTLKN